MLWIWDRRQWWWSIFRLSLQRASLGAWCMLSRHNQQWNQWRCLSLKEPCLEYSCQLATTATTESSMQRSWAPTTAWWSLDWQETDAEWNDLCTQLNWSHCWYANLWVVQMMSRSERTDVLLANYLFTSLFEGCLKGCSVHYSTCRTRISGQSWSFDWRQPTLAVPTSLMVRLGETLPSNLKNIVWLYYRLSVEEDISRQLLLLFYESISSMPSYLIARKKGFR